MEKEDIVEKVINKMMEVESVDCSEKEYNHDANNTGAKEYNKQYFADAYITENFIFVNNSSTQYLLFKEDLSEMNLDGCTKKELFELYKEIEKEVEEQKKIQKREDEEIKNYFKSKE